jgi:hypothetical protein
MRYRITGTGSDHDPSHGRVDRLLVVTGEDGMASRDEWFAIHTSSPGESSPTTVGAAKNATVGFYVDPDAAPVLRTAFEEAIEEMKLARQAMQDMRLLGGGSVNPVVDKFLAALAEVGYGEQGSVVMAADSAIAEYQNVIDQLEFIMVGYQNREEAIKDHLGRLQP